MVSLNINDLLKGGGGPPEGNYVIRESGFSHFNYRGRGPLTTTLRLMLRSDFGRTFEQHYSVGDASRYSYKDGRLYTQPPKSSNFGVLMQSLSEKGFPRDLLAAGDITALSGLYAYWEHLSRARGGEIRSILVPAEIHRFPGEERGDHKGDSTQLLNIAKKMGDEFSRPELIWRVIKVCDKEEATRLHAGVLGGEYDALLEESGYHVTATMIRRVD